MFADPQMSYEDVVQLRQNLGLDKPILVQYVYWLKGVCKGELGYSHIYGKPVMTALLERLPATLILSISSFTLIIIITFPLGLLSGAKKDSLFDNIVMVGSFIGLAIPTFWLGLMLILGLSLKLDLFPTSGFMNQMMMDTSIFWKALDISYHLCLPLLTILIGGIAGLTRYHRFGIIGILTEEYMTAGRARGLSENRLLFKHAFKNAALPIITILGLSIPSLISGSFVIEYIFAWPGLGQLGISSIFARDYPIIMGTILFSSFLIILGNLIADLAYSWVDPRIERHA